MPSRLILDGSMGSLPWDASRVMGQGSLPPWVSQLPSKVPSRQGHGGMVWTPSVHSKAEAVPTCALGLGREDWQLLQICQELLAWESLFKLSSLLNSGHKGKKNKDIEICIRLMFARDSEPICIRRGSHSDTHKSEILEQHRR